MGESLPSAAHDPAGAELQDSQDQVDKFQRHIEEIVKEADDSKMQEIRMAVQKAVQTTLERGTFDGTIAGAVQASIKVAESKIAAIMSAVDAAAAEEEPEKLDASAKKSGSLASQAAEGFKAIGSFFAQAAMGGAELPTLMREEEEAYTAQSIVLPLRRLAACSDTMAEKDALTGGSFYSKEVPTEEEGKKVPSEEGKQAADAGQQHAKDIREAQQKELYQRTGDILYPPSEGTEAPIEKGSGSQGDIKIGAPQGASGANVEGITQSAADASLKEESWDAPARSSVATEGSAPDTHAPTALKGTAGHGDALGSSTETKPAPTAAEPKQKPDSSAPAGFAPSGLAKLAQPGGTGGLQEEDWNAPGRTVPTGTQPSDMKGSMGHSAKAE